MQGFALTVLRLYDRAVDDDQRVAPMHGVALPDEEGVDAAKEFATDAYLCGLGLALQRDGRLMSREVYDDEGGYHDDDDGSKGPGQIVA